MAILVTKWFGVFLCDEKTGRILDKRLMPKDAAAVADKLAAVQRGALLDEERELTATVDGRIAVADRRQSELGKPEMYDSSSITPEKYGYDGDFMHEVMIGLGKLRTSEPIPRDRSLVQAIRSLDDQIATINLYNERLHEWYGMHFPELADYAHDARYAQLIAMNGEREGVIEELGIDIESIGADMDPSDMDAIRDLADTLSRLYDDKDRTETYIQGIVEETCPNMCAILGAPLAARMVSLAGGLERLASLRDIPASRRPQGALLATREDRPRSRGQGPHRGEDRPIPRRFRRGQAQRGVRQTRGGHQETLSGSPQEAPEGREEGTPGQRRQEPSPLMLALAQVRFSSTAT